MRKHKKFLSAILASSLLVTPISHLIHQNNNISKAYVNIANNTEENLLNKDLKYIKLLDKMPMNVAEGTIEEGIKWLNENKGKDFGFGEFIATGDSIKFQSYYRSWSCVYGIGTAVVNLLPWSKILKLKQGAKALGGLQTVASNIYNRYKYLINNYRSYKNNKWGAMKLAVTETANSMPGEAKAAFMEFFGLGGLNDCFD
ncbi:MULTISPECIES: hypothetical protein [unclassified Gemella]|uniref:hypothetical protein n=1 Tax=unclassified Gemella TaxID=2624949 RepID=UPI001C04F100|nr:MULTISPECIES: hypothetical protein [unclassified Gemella]MBU0278999.1 hypothetical protein [Gemella sp. zg-1178]QWQ38737.1 hypothetical protein KMP11_07290 [Gemella sp. zg-570]